MLSARSSSARWGLHANKYTGAIKRKEKRHTHPAIPQVFVVLCGVFFARACPSRGRLINSRGICLLFRARIIISEYPSEPSRLDLLPAQWSPRRIPQRSTHGPRPPFAFLALPAACACALRSTFRPPEFMYMFSFSVRFALLLPCAGGGGGGGGSGCI